MSECYVSAKDYEKYWSSMNEAAFITHLTGHLRKATKFVVFKHADRFTHGVPDISMTGNSVTSWWELKVADPEFDSPGIQELTMIRLAAGGCARYLIYSHGTIRIVEPRNLRNWNGNIPHPYDVKWLIDEMLFIHNSVRSHVQQTV